MKGERKIPFHLTSMVGRVLENLFRENLKLLIRSYALKKIICNTDSETREPARQNNRPFIITFFSV